MRICGLCAAIALLTLPVVAQEAGGAADFVERIEPDALKQASVVIATVQYEGAMRDGKFPR